MAAKAGQILQAELLVVYGADPGAPDINGRTPMDYARYRAGGNRLPVCVYERWGVKKRLTALCVLCSRQAGHVELAERLVECQYELTDRLAFYLCGRRPGNPPRRGRARRASPVTSVTFAVAFTPLFSLLSSPFPSPSPQITRMAIISFLKWRTGMHRDPSSFLFFWNEVLVSPLCLHACCGLIACSVFVSILALCSSLTSILF